MTQTLLDREKLHLAGLLEAIQRCVYFLDAASSSLSWPLNPETLKRQKKDKELFGALGAFNERFAKLQDTLGAAMRHAMGLLGEPSEVFLKVLAFFEKVAAIESIEAWQNGRTARNLAAHSHETDYQLIADHFNLLRDLLPMLYGSSARFVSYCETNLNIAPSSTDFAAEFAAIVQSIEKALASEKPLAIEQAMAIEQAVSLEKPGATANVSKQ
ncbi:MAG: hypothetical protein ACKVQK_02170 [Burkholderiales bacterium]